MSLPRLAVGRPVTTAMILLSVVVLGAITFQRIPRAFLPEIDAPFIAVQIPYPNSNPSQIEREITKPVEEVLATLPGVKKMQSSSSADQAGVQLLFDWGQSLDVVRMQVSEKIEQVKPSLPEGIGEVLIFSFSTSDIPVIQARVSATGVDLSESYELLESRILNPLRRVPGVAKVDLGGVAPKEINIDLILDQVKAHNVDVGALIQRLQGGSSNMVLGEVREGGMRYTARALGQFSSVEDFERLVINDRGIRLGDIADIKYEEPVLRYGRHLDGTYAIALEIYKESTANTVDVVRSAMRVIREDIGSDPLLQGVSVFVWEDQGAEITNGINGLTRSGMVGGLLAVLVLYFFLRRLDSTLIVSLTIPFSIIAACGVLFFMGKSLNILSMMGLMLGVGMLVDNAVVVLESIDRRHRDVADTKRSALEGAQSVTVAVTAATVTTLIVFLPLIVGQKNDLTIWLSEVGLAISLALLCSLFSSQTLIPLMSAHLLRPKKAKPIRSIEWLEERYARILHWTLHHWVKMVLIIVAFLLIGIAPFFLKLVQTGMFSATVNDRLYLQYEFTGFAYKSDSKSAVEKVEAFLEANRDRFNVGSIYSYFAENDAGTTIVLARGGISDSEMKKLRNEIREELPEVAGAKIFFRDDQETGGSSTYFAVRFFGQDTAVLEKFAAEAERRLETVKGVEDVRSSLRGVQREIQVSIDRDKAFRSGLTARDLSDIFGFTLGGMRLQRFNAGDREVETWLALQPEDRTNLEDLKSIVLRTQAGRELQLGDIASFEIVQSAAQIRRENRKIRVAVNATYDGEKWGDAKQEITKLMNAFDFPPGYSWSWSDRIVEQEGQGQQMMINMLLALLLVYIVMASLFESVTQPFAILFSIPFALPGVAWLLAITKTPFNLMAQIGLLILIGIVVNNGIVLIDHLNQLRAKGLGREEAIIQAGRDRMRAILMTAATTITGLLPLAIGSSAVSGLMYFPMARTVMGGLISSTFLTLLILPFIYDRVERVTEWFGRLWKYSAPRAAAPVPVTVDETASSS
jgi:hydrophobic/amphiphilic exporter-1 (mainly G- bacteria), HAE1 family